MNKDYLYSIVPANLINVMWHILWPIIERVIAISNEELSEEGVKQRALSGTTMIVAVCKKDKIVAVVVLDIVCFDTGLRTLYLPIVGGDFMDEWLDDGIEVAKAIAKDLKCTELRGLASRPGWLRRLKDHGWTTVTTVIKCEIEV